MRVSGTEATMISTQLVVLLLVIAGLAFYAGYVFGRQVNYLSGGGFNPGDTFLLRAGIVF